MGSSNMSKKNPDRPSHRQLSKLCEDIKHLDISVHGEILKLVGEEFVTWNQNGAFFDLCSLDDSTVARIKSTVEYATSTREPLRRHDVLMFENAQRLVSGPVTPATESTGDDPPISDHRVDGEDAFCTRMDTWCIGKAAKGVFLKRSP